jgi:hypothetical protein
MIKKSQKTTTETVNTRYCDFCGDKMISQYSSTYCHYCGKDVCKKCVGHVEDTGGDYYENYCKRCWEIGENYRTKIKHFEDEIERLYDEWIMKCKE